MDLFSVSNYNSLRTSEIHLFYNLQVFYWHFLEILWLFIFLVLYLWFLVLYLILQAQRFILHVCQELSVIRAYVS